MPPVITHVRVIFVVAIIAKKTGTGLAVRIAEIEVLVGWELEIVSNSE